MNSLVPLIFQIYSCSNLLPSDYRDQRATKAAVDALIRPRRKKKDVTRTSRTKDYMADLQQRRESRNQRMLGKFFRGGGTLFLWETWIPIKMKLLPVLVSLIEILAHTIFKFLQKWGRIEKNQMEYLNFSSQKALKTNFMHVKGGFTQFSFFSHFS